jgi:hypothetical protein
LFLNAETRAYLEQPDFKAMLDDVSSNPQKLTNYFNDPRFAKALEVGMGLSFAMPPGGREPPGAGAEGSTERSAPPAPPPAQTKIPEPEPELEEVELTDEEKSEKEAKEAALKVRPSFGTAWGDWVKCCKRIVIWSLFVVLNLHLSGLLS